MGRKKNTPESGGKGSHFTYEQRRMLEALWKGRVRESGKLAEILGKDRRTMGRELKRGAVEPTDGEPRNCRTY
ncbi:MAG: helix-turn-helix domain-containing protein, partial [Spirochaetaceae bacterium]|nr:helix-turn-helix domain-containing protein [Spirochaetaceae bacterium]